MPGGPASRRRQERPTRADPGEHEQNGAEVALLAGAVTGLHPAARLGADLPLLVALVVVPGGSPEVGLAGDSVLVGVKPLRVAGAGFECLLRFLLGGEIGTVPVGLLGQGGAGEGERGSGGENDGGGRGAEAYG